MSDNTKSGTLRGASIASAFVLANPTFTPVEAYGLLQQFTKVIATQLSAGRAVYLDELGTFTPYTSLPRKGRNPRNPTVEIVIPPKTRVSFTPSARLRRKLNP